MRIWGLDGRRLRHFSMFLSRNMSHAERRLFFRLCLRLTRAQTLPRAGVSRRANQYNPSQISFAFTLLTFFATLFFFFREMTPHRNGNSRHRHLQTSVASHRDPTRNLVCHELMLASGRSQNLISCFFKYFFFAILPLVNEQNILSTI